MSAHDATVDIRIELPTHSRSFSVQAGRLSTIRDVKSAITTVCPGSPRADGQRLIHKGRFVHDDEIVGEIWKNPDEAHVLHLSVHPSAWTNGPPASLSSPSQTVPYTAPAPMATPGVLPLSVPYSVPVIAPVANAAMANASMLPYSTLGYVCYKHARAIHVLMHGMHLDDPVNNGDNGGAWRAAAVEMLGQHGWAWPTLLDEDYPALTQGGLKYERTTIDGLSYLSLTNPGAEPTPVQAHALKVLSVTFTILSTLGLYAAPDPTSPAYVAQNIVTTNLNEHLQRLGLPALRFGQIPLRHLNMNNVAPAQAVEMRAIPLRAVLVPFLMVTFRTILLFYFFGPTKRPFFAFLVMAWILYEAWGAIRLVLGYDRPRDRPQAGGAEAAAAHPPGQPQAQPQAAPAQQPHRAPRRPRGANANRSAMQSFLAGLSNLNLRREDSIIDTGANVPRPSISHKVKTFVVLILLTLYPAVWDHRRAALRRREGRLRTEQNAREAARSAEGEQDRADADAERARLLERLANRRPAWVKGYVERVLTTDWADEL